MCAGKKNYGSLGSGLIPIGSLGSVLNSIGSRKKKMSVSVPRFGQRVRTYLEQNRLGELGTE
jgi:hypothetical protein